MIHASGVTNGDFRFSGPHSSRSEESKSHAGCKADFFFKKKQNIVILIRYDDIVILIRYDDIVILIRYYDIVILIRFYDIIIIIIIIIIMLYLTAYPLKIWFFIC